MPDRSDGQLEPQIPHAYGPAGGPHGDVARAIRVQARVHALFQVTL
jgi:hypothetical protein